MSPWIISRRQDLLWFHLSVAAGLLLLLLFALGPRLSDATYAADHPLVIALLLWGVLFDGTHVFGTYVRSYLAEDAASRRALPGNHSFLLVFVGPLLAITDAALLPQQPSMLGHAGWLFRGFLLFSYLWAYYHLLRQHYGLLVLYQRRLPPEVAGARLDAAFLWIGCLYPYLRFSLGDGYAHSGLPVLIASPTWRAHFSTALDLGAGLFAGGLFILLVRRCIRNRGAGPRELFLGIVVGFHLLVFARLDNLLLITAALTIFHNLQYHRIVWQYERGHGRVPAGSLRRYLAWGLGLGLLWYGPRVIGVAAASAGLFRNLLLGLGWGVALHHYFVDGRIWRVRRTPEVAQALDRAVGKGRA